ncbi:hypothetical protein N8I77_006429 [Diaporthe amygdali]|uniref:Uncharacterized protein n=1 Tax=Phomopsis amygdali TaxID=1214568 RepID=A0AAD9W5Q8_PHOAM|nr:hypothetical protein N8I77_006429 [Diaporthe amygdali]
MSAPRLSRTSSAHSQNVVTRAVGRRSRSFLAGFLPVTAQTAPAPASTPSSSTSKPLTTLQEANTRNLPEVWFNPTFPYANTNTTPPLGQGPNKPPDDRKAKLGKTLRILQERLPTLLQSPLPTEILAPNISLHLFPSTHPHLPTVSGRVAYIAALWTAPMTWNRLPIIGDVELEIMSERMVKQPGTRQGAVSEKLVVRWRTTGKGIGSKLPFRDKQTAKEFWGLFIFEFDSEGRVLSHTIEHVQSGGDWDKGIGAKFVGLTDWLLGGMRGPEGCPAFEIHQEQRPQRRR